MSEPRGLIAGYRHALNERKTEQASFLADGKATDWEDYRYHCGIVAGLRTARDEFDRMVRKYIEEESED